eukprot:6201977-Pleurochrysis_carterae.AAC.3
MPPLCARRRAYIARVREDRLRAGRMHRGRLRRRLGMRQHTRVALPCAAIVLSAFSNLAAQAEFCVVNRVDADHCAIRTSLHAREG